MTFVKKTLAPAQQMAILRSCPLFQAAEDDDLTLVLADSTHRQFAAGELISREGETVKACPLMISGQIDVFRHT
ncbi:hypothetical protein [Morganella morganii]